MLKINRNPPHGCATVTAHCQLQRFNYLRSGNIIDQQYYNMPSIIRITPPINNCIHRAIL